MRNKVKIIVAVIVIMVFAILGYTQLYRPISIKPKMMECITWDSTYEGTKARAESYNNGELDKETTFVHAFDGKLPSEDPNDYMDIYCTLEITNRSIFDLTYIDAIVLELGPYADNVLFSTSASHHVTGTGSVFKLSKGNITFFLNIYIGDLDEAAIKELARGIKAKVIYKGEAIELKEEIIDFSRCKDITLENTLTNW